MIDAAQLARMVDETPGDAVVLSKEQIRELLGEIAAGNSARRLLVNLRSMIGAAQTSAV